MTKNILTLLLFINFANANLFDFITISKAKELYKRGDFNNSIKEFQKLKQDNPVYNYNLANSYYKASRYKKAVTYYKRAFGNGVDETNRLFNLGNSYFNLKDYEKAIFAYKMAQKIKDSKETRANLLLALKMRETKEKKSQKEKDKKSKKLKKKKQDKKRSKKNSEKKNSKKLNNKEIKKVQKLTKKNILNKKMRNMIKKSYKNRKIPILMYKIKVKDKNNMTNNPW